MTSDERLAAISRPRSPAFPPTANDTRPVLGDRSRKVELIVASTIQPVETQYVLYPYFPRGEATWLEGVTKSGKTMAGVDILARQTRGDAFRNGSRIAQGRVAILTCEDDPARTLVPRLIAASANLEYVEMIRVTEDGADRTPSFLHDMEAIERQLSAKRVTTIFVDGTFGMLGVKDGSSYTEAYGVMLPFVAMVRRIDIAAMIVRHVRKSEGSALNKGIGSVGYASLARSTISVAVDRDDDTGVRRLFAHAGSNVGETGPTLAFAIEGVTVAGFERQVGRVVWGEIVDVTADDAMGSRVVEDSTQIKVAEDFIHDFLTAPSPKKDVVEAAHRLKINPRTLQRAAERLHVTMTRSGFGAGSIWSPPDSDLNPIRAKNHHSCQVQTPGTNGTNDSKPTLMAVDF